MNIIIAGAGKIGMRLIQQLSAEEHNIYVIESDNDVMNLCREHYDIYPADGNCCVKGVLEKANVKSADMIIAVTGSDERNMLCCMIARHMNSNIYAIARVRDPEYIDQWYEMGSSLGLQIINPERKTAEEIAHMIKYPGFLKLDTFAKGRAEIVELKITAESKLCNVRLNNINSVIKCKVLICVILRDGRVILPSGDTILLDGDRIFVTAPAQNLSMLLTNLGITTHKAKRVAICGGGRISYYLAEMLHTSNVSVTILEQDKDLCEKLAQMIPYASVLRCDASSQTDLEEQNIGEYNTLVALTGLDELNIIIALYGNKFKIPQVITKLGKMDSSQIPDILPIGSTISPRDLCCSNIVEYVRSIQYKTGAAIAVHFIADGKAEAIEFRVTDETNHRGEPLRMIKLKKNILLCCITHEKKIDIPDGDSSFNTGDTVIIATDRGNSVNTLNEIFAD